MVPGEVLRYCRRVGKTCDKAEVSTGVEHLLQELRSSMLLEREARLHGAAGIDQQAQAQRQFGLRSELQYAFRRLVVIADLDLADFEVSYVPPAAGDAKKYCHLIHCLANRPLRSGAASRIELRNRRSCGRGTFGSATRLGCLSSRGFPRTSEFGLEPVGVSQALLRARYKRDAGLRPAGSGGLLCRLLVPVENIKIVARGRGQRISGVLLHEERELALCDLPLIEVGGCDSGYVVRVPHTLVWQPVHSSSRLYRLAIFMVAILSVGQDGQ